MSAGLILSIAAGAPINLLVTRHFKAPIAGLNVLCGFMATLLLVICATSGTSTPPAMMLLSSIPFCFAIIGARRSMLTWLVLVALMLVLLYYLPVMGLNLPSEPRKNLPLIFGLEVAILSLFVTITAYTGVRGRRALLDELTRAKLEVEHARDEAIKANEAKTQFLARISHELRTPLNGIIGFTQILVADKANSLNNKQRERLHYVEASGQNLLSLVNEILDISYIESGEMNVVLAPLDVANSLREAVGSIEPMAQAAGITLSLAPGNDLWVFADQQRLGQSLTNLLSNAIKFNRPQGKVVVAAVAAENEVRISITDTGNGLRDDEIDKLFQPFNRLGAAASHIEGSGLGLVITRALIERMQGRLEVASTPRSGSTFSIILSQHAPAQAPAAKPADVLLPHKTAENLPTNDAIRQVLYVEDNPVNVLLMEAMFERLPQVKLHIAVTGTEGIAAARQINPDLLLLDINLPDCTGIELLTRIRREQASSAPTIAVSADAMPDDIQQALDSGFSEYWTKPIDMQQKLQTLSTMLDTPLVD